MMHLRMLHQKLGQVRGKMKDFSAYGNTQPPLMTLAELNNLDFLKTKAQLLGSRFQQ